MELWTQEVLLLLVHLIDMEPYWLLAVMMDVWLFGTS